MIRAGLTEEAVWGSGEWVFVDMGFAQSSRSCGLLVHDGEPDEVTFAELCRRVIEVASRGSDPLNLLIEAPLSVAFLPNGNPTGRAGERRGSVTRYWYVGLGCSIMVAAAYMLRGLVESQPTREVRLFEGLASFKVKGEKSSHAGDVVALRRAVREGMSRTGSLITPDDLAVEPGHTVRSAFAVAGMDFGVPPVIVLCS